MARFQHTRNLLPSMPTRRRVREIVLQLLYQHDLNHEQKAEDIEQFLNGRLLNSSPLTRFARQLLDGTLKNQRLIDQAITARAANWTVRRMAFIDRNILRLGTFEILLSDTPGQVAINEAVELAKRYGDRNSANFVNGILDRILNDPPSIEDVDQQEHQAVNNSKTQPESGSGISSNVRNSSQSPSQDGLFQMN